MPSPLAEAFLMGILNGCYETPSKIRSLRNARKNGFDGKKARLRASAVQRKKL